MKRHPRYIFPVIIIIICVVSLCGLFLSRYLRTVRYHSDQARRNDIAALTSEDYNCLLLSMYSTASFNPGDFSYYRGLPTLKADHRFETLADIGDYLRAALDANQEITNIYIGLDAPAISEQYGFHASLYQRTYNRQLLELMSANPQIAFEVLLPYYSLDYWDTLSAEKQAEFLTSYKNFVNIFAGQPNVTIYFPGYEEWLIANPGNYDTADSCNPSVTSTLLAFTFRDDHYKLTPDNMEERIAALETLIDSRNNIPYSEPASGTSSEVSSGSFPESISGLADYEFVFFGDSVIGNYTDSLSIPGVVQGISGARTFNLGHGGTCAAMSRDPSSPSLNTIVDAFLAKNGNGLAADSQPCTGLQEYLSNATSAQTNEDARICFVINYGLNDFFTGSPIDSEDPFNVYTYKGSLRTAVAKLQTTYPDSTILLLTPNFCTYFGNGTQPQGEQGGKLTDYVNAVLELSEELDVYCLDNYNSLGINARNQAEYLEDGCHPNELGRYRIGKQILRIMGDQ